MFWVSFFCVLSIWIIWDRFHEKFKKETVGLQLESFLKILKISWSKYCFCIHASLYLLYQYLEKKSLNNKKDYNGFQICVLSNNIKFELHHGHKLHNYQAPTKRAHTIYYFLHNFSLWFHMCLLPVRHSTEW